MFFKKKNQNELLNKIYDKLDILEGNIDSLNQCIAKDDKNLENINQNIAVLQSAVNKHDMAIDDLLDEWEEKSSDESSTQKLLQECRQNENQLLELFEAYLEQFWNLKHFADTKGEAWADQMTLMGKKLEHYHQLYGISVIKECGVEVDYNLHEIIKAVDTPEPGQDKTVAEIYHCGYIYKGKVRKKATVSAYRFAAR